MIGYVGTNTMDMVFIWLHLVGKLTRIDKNNALCTLIDEGVCIKRMIVQSTYNSAGRASRMYTFQPDQEGACVPEIFFILLIKNSKRASIFGVKWDLSTSTPCAKLFAVIRVRVSQEKGGPEKKNLLFWKCHETIFLIVGAVGCQCCIGVSGNVREVVELGIENHHHRSGDQRLRLCGDFQRRIDKVQFRVWILQNVLSYNGILESQRHEYAHPALFRVLCKNIRQGLGNVIHQDVSGFHSTQFLGIRQHRRP
jgi:hypothetical protein